MTQGIKVGDFSRITHLSVKTLRHYHEAGLLEPETVDKDSGYRYYSIEQVPTAQVIRRLRDLEMPLAEVKAVLTTPDSAGRNALIAAHLDRLEAELVRTQTAVDSLRRLLGAADGKRPVEYRTVMPEPAMGIREVLDRKDALLWWRGALGELHANLLAQGLRSTGPAGGIFASEIFQQDIGEATLFIPVEGVVRRLGRVAPFVVPAAELAIMTHFGPLSDLDVTYGELGSHVSANQISIDGPLYEYYVRGPNEFVDSAQWQTEIGWPIFRADAGRRIDSSPRPLLRPGYQPTIRIFV